MKYLLLIGSLRIIFVISVFISWRLLLLCLYTQGLFSPSASCTPTDTWGNQLLL